MGSSAATRVVEQPCLMVLGSPAENGPFETKGQKASFDPRGNGELKRGKDTYTYGLCLFESIS